MIDIEKQIYTKVAQALREEFTNLTISSEYVKAPPSFPYISVIESDSYTSTTHLDTSDTERFATIMYEVNVFSNKTGGKKNEARKIMAKVNELMYGLNFTRIAQTPVPNLEDATIYRLVARYRAETDGNTIYRR